MRLTPSDASETMPRPLWNDHHHPGFQRIGLRPVLGHDVKSHRTVDDLHGAHGDRHHGVWYSGPEVRPVSADRERVPHRASLAGGQSDRRQHRRPAADRAGWRVLAFAAIRFRETTRDIDAEEVRPGPGERLDITLVALRLLLGAILFVYLVYTGTRWL